MIINYYIWWIYNKTLIITLIVLIILYYQYNSRKIKLLIINIFLNY